MTNKIAPAPWHLTGQGYVLAVYLPTRFLDQHSFIPAHLQNSRRGRIAYIIFADYQQSDVGAYYELLYIGGSLAFGEQRHHSISKIYVSSQDSIDNGQKNWGIPKEMAQFKVSYGANNQDSIALTTPTGDIIAQLHFSHHLLRFPVSTKLAPTRLITLAQDWHNTRFFFAPQANGHLKPALLKDCYINSQYFPDIAQGRVVACFKVTDFSLIFPVPKTQVL